jgi:iron complex outermembrane recepter protein
MKSKRSSIPYLQPLMALSLSLLPRQALAQPEQELIVLNPFVVTTDSASGYYATETLSGTQLRTQVRDLANPITILTEEFMRDIGAVNYEEALEFLPSTREFKTDASDQEGNSSRNSTAYMVRGFRSNSLTNNFFTSRIKVDNYNTETVTQSRGPNSLLFGLGSVGGALDATNKTGRFNANSYALETRFDSEGTRRASVDINQILIPKKLAVRFAALSADQRSPRELQYSRRNSAYLNLSIQPFKGATINLNAEAGRIDESLPRPYIAYDSVSAWLNSPLTPFQKANRSDASVANPNATARNIITGVTQGLPTNNYLVYIMNAPQLGVLNWRNKSKGSEIVVNGVTQGQTSLSKISVVPGVNFPLDTAVQGPGEHNDTTFEKYSVSWQQKVLEKTYLELAGVYEKSFNEDWQPIQRGDYEVFIDNNYYLPTQLASTNPDPTKPLNPYFGVPYLEGGPLLQTRDSVTQQWRATLTHQLDLRRFEPVKGFDFGKFTAVAFYYFRDDDTFNTQDEEATTTSLLSTGAIAGSAAGTQNLIKRRYYLLPGQPVSFPSLGIDELSKINQAANPAVVGGVVPAITSAMVSRLNNSHAPTTTRSKAAIGQWELFSRRVILTGGIRQDAITTENFLFDVIPVTLLNGGRGQGTFAPATTAKVTNKNAGVVVKVTKWLDAFANKSTNTVAAGGSAYNIYNESLPNQEGDGYDFGVRGFFLDDRVILKVNYFKNVAENRVSNPLRDGAIGIEMARLNGYVERYLEGMVLNGQGAKVAGAKRFSDYQTSNGLWTDLESDAAEGYEVEVTLNPTKQLRLMGNVSYNDATLNGTYKFTRPWYDKYVLPFRNDTAITSLIANPVFNATRTIGEYMAGMERRLNYHEAQVGGARIRGNNWLVNLVGSYAFDQGPLKGARVGASARWRDAPSIGYPEVAGTFDVKRPFKGAESLVTDAFVSYSWKANIRDQKTNWSVSIRVRNLLDHDEYYPNNAVDYGDGIPHILQKMYVQPRTYELTAGMRF